MYFGGNGVPYRVMAGLQPVRQGPRNQATFRNKWAERKNSESDDSQSADDSSSNEVKMINIIVIEYVAAMIQ